MNRKYYLAESYRVFRAYCNEHKITASDQQYIATNRLERIAGLELSRDDLVIIGDPMMPYSFWVNLQTRLRK